MANEFLYKAVTNVGNLIYTASREDTDGKPITDVAFKTAQPVQLSGSNAPLEVELSEQIVEDNRLKINLQNDIVSRLPQQKIFSDVTLKPELSAYDAYVVKWIDKNGALYSTYSGSAIRKSTDYGKTWNQLWAIPDVATYGEVWNGCLFVTDTGRVVVSTYKGYVFASDENQQNFTQIVKFDSGYTSSQFGHGTYENFAWVAEYSGPAATGIPKDVYISNDYGATWTKTYTTTVEDVNKQNHIHDLEYDPYAKRFWMVVGDQANSKTLYSDDYGYTWTNVYGLHSNNAKSMQLTSISVFHHGVVFGTDTADGRSPDGLHYWKRPEGVLRPFVDYNDIKPIFYFKDDLTFRIFAEKTSHIQIGDKKIHFVSWYGGSGYAPALLASIDGLNWFEVWKAQDSAYQQFRVVGGDIVDGKPTIFGHINNPSNPPNSYRTFKAVIPYMDGVNPVPPAPTVIKKEQSSIARFENITLAAGQTKVLVAQTKDLTGFDWVSVGVIPQATHTWKVTADVYGTSNAFAYAESIITTASQNRKLSSKYNLRTDRLLIILKNEDSVSQTYTDIEVFAGY